MKIKTITVILALLCLFIVIGSVSATENLTDNQLNDNSDILMYSNDEKVLQSTNNEEFLQIDDNKDTLNKYNSEVLEVESHDNEINNTNSEKLQLSNEVEALASYDTYYDFDAEYDSSVKECNYYYTFYTQHHGKVKLEVDAKDVKKLAIASANKKYKIITYETIQKKKVTIKYTKTFLRKYKEMGHTVKLTNKQWKKEKLKVKKLLKKGWKVSKRTSNMIKLTKKVSKKTKIYFDLVNYPNGYKYWWTGYHSQYVRIYTNYYPDLDEDIASVAW